ncbi:hypothetical protein BT96DRAFT_830690 [Gymnopus androsaceus JB14]|uniref:Uncharacterized protein n=1 Tax=Gymnopus androsaceus JB14 TaxID=1447944 RepID=A0A6A4H3U2_9AGAR|nr:hypothetical protein BT96DRAFT_830690 [Gymnopus androsaceus JB14]
MTASVVKADSCNDSGVYCGQSLLNKGNYMDHIIQVLQANKQPTDKQHIIDSLFDYVSNGDIVYEEFCANGCGGIGNTEDDFCL